MAYFLYNICTMGLSTEFGPPTSFENDPDSTTRLAELYANIALTDVFMHGAAITSFGILQYPSILEYDKGNMNQNNMDLYNQGRIITVRPDEINADVTDSSHPPIIYLIPPGSVNRLVIKEHFRGKRKLQPSIMLYHGMDDSNKPITDSVTGSFHLMEGLKLAVLQKMRDHNIEPKSTLDRAPKTIAKEALINIAFSMGLGNIDEVIKKTLEEIAMEKNRAVSVAESIMNGGEH